MNKYKCKTCGVLSYSSVEIEFMTEPKCSACGGEIAPARDKPKLLPCSHCGGEAFTSTCAEVDWFVFCDTCHAGSGAFKTEQEAVDNWNRRTPDIVRCGECRKFRTPSCSAKHEQGTADFCSHGLVREGA
jgi:Lar family restriction alleviation protein